MIPTALRGEGNGHSFVCSSCSLSRSSKGNVLGVRGGADGLSGRGAGEWSERQESWSLDADGRLRVEIVTEAHDRPRKTTELRYRRE
jgi:hypothetical protein